MRPSALIAEDEPLLAQALAQELKQLWPELDIRALVGDGLSAVESALTHQPDVVFMDIRMPGQDGLAAAEAMTERWTPGQALPLIVFVTAHDDHALAAFEAQALDYLLKPVRKDRLARTVQRLQMMLDSRPSDELMLNQLRALLAGGSGAEPPLKLLQASSGARLVMVPIHQVLVLEAADKYVRVLTQDGQELWLRTPLKDLLPKLDATQFWQIHRGTVVRAEAIRSAWRDDQGQWRIALQDPGGEHRVSRLYAHRFGAM